MRSEKSIEQRRGYARNYYHENKLEIVQYQKQRKASPSYKKAWRDKQRENRLASRVRLLMLLGGRCERCGFNDLRALQVDHVKGNGRKEDSQRHAHRMLKRVFERPEAYQLLCSNCNWIKRYENDETRRAVA